MEEKILSILGELLKGQEELRSDVTALKDGQEELRSDVAALIVGQATLRSEVTQIKLTLEHKTNVKIQALFDAREVQKDVNQQIFAELDEIKGKIDRLQIETAHVRVAK
ncbi:MULTISPECIES: hypothetical protein [Desulfitobacterium]|uniref:Uncharacterized protein n=1 Tax=Desulfitobacterium dehalogenans (strain ATCC 51507 / DSM 9161 / JW/IU-DC1) TaxID=756499 RepID=I4ADV0_DESDJ|nr:MULTISPECIES: hypothetical protein [Desulfitobacterium]AFM02135.1 hypothetical protein Desde_3868 [Desulfitobacterium dehalogenans ATCC 51507]